MSASFHLSTPLTERIRRFSFVGSRSLLGPAFDFLTLKTLPFFGWKNYAMKPKNLNNIFQY